MKQNFRSMKSKLILLLALLSFVPIGVFAQSVTVKGTVLDGTGETIIGATVVEKGNTSNGVTTNLDGQFTLTLPKGKKLVISYVGMETQEVDAVAGKDLKIVLKDDSQALEEVVVIGYGGSKARKDLTGSVGSISGAKLAAVPVTSAAVALQGKIAGVQVTSVDGAPGADINIRVRGGTSVTQSNEPLYIVDGFQVDNINDIPPTDIASIDVLKDASITAIYGAKGGNGVVVVTTKSAKAGKIQVSFNANLSTSHLSKKLDLMDSYDFARYQYEWSACNGSRSSRAKFFRANFGNPQDLDMYSTLPTHDWQDEVMGENPLNYSTNVTVGGGTEKMRFNLSLTQSEDKGIIMGSGVRRTNLNIKTAIDITKNLTLQINPKFSFRRDEGAGGDNIGTGGIIDVLRYRPTNGLREYGYVDPSYADPDEEELFTYTNPKSDISINQQNKYSYNYTNAFSLEWKPIKGLVLRTEATIGLQWKDQYRFWGALTGEGQKNNSLPLAKIQKEKAFKYIWTNTASYGFALNEHDFSFLLGQEVYHSQNEKSVQENRYFPRAFEADQAWANMGFGTPKESTTSLSTPDRTASFFGQFSYNYSHRYLLSLTMRADGSTKFAPGNQWGYFPSVAGAWVLSEENFLDDIEWLEQLKIRAAVGLAGNNRIDNDMWRYLYSINSTGGPGFGEATQFGEQWYGNQGGDKFANKGIKWETTLTRNIAADIVLFDGRLTITPEFYWNTTKDLLYRSDIPSATGYVSQMQNIGQVTNKGIELSISGDILRGKDYVLSANFSMGMNKRKVDKLNGTDNVIWDQNNRWKSSYSDYCLKVGDEVGLIYGFVYDGLYSMDEFYFDAPLNYQALPWGSSAAYNGSSKDQPLVDANGVEHPRTVINLVSGDSNSGIATLPGKVKFKDLNGDGFITEEDRTVIGNTNPKLQGGFGLSGQWKNLDFAMNFNFMLDFDVNNATAYQLSSSESNNNKFYNALSKYADAGWRYTRDGDGECMYKCYFIDGSVDMYRQLNEGRTLWNPTDVTKKITHSYFIEDGSFLRCQDLTIGYTLPTQLTSKWGISKARFYVSASNLFIITGYSGYDPEVDVQTGLTCGMDYNRYPRSRSFVFGTNITF
ncbi:TonB-linked outer membrane protein, SusC/RagA family [Bacteroides stercorirosoris]|uniref:TonB-linked outer membrane protein, SusC/RagA family n=2 Tax=Bacteroides stercorirosoris TaxID=871324 RepID=A0A1M6B2V6_9BACE|nr:TonB-linked outer membrane protein, SusC/RagA family [Bacteroides stercorirosoris]